MTPPPADGLLDSSKYMAARHRGPVTAPPAVISFAGFTDSELWPLARCMRSWERGDVDRFGFAPACLARLKALMHAAQPADPD